MTWKKIKRWLSETAMIRQVSSNSISILISNLQATACQQTLLFDKELSAASSLDDDGGIFVNFFVVCKFTSYSLIELRIRSDSTSKINRQYVQ